MMGSRTSVTMNSVEHGTGTAVLALHGWSPDHRLMLGCLEPVFAMREGYRRLYPDLPGQGLTPAPPSIASSDDVLDVLQDFIDDRIGDAPFLLVGESHGGYHARAIVRSRAEQVLGLAMICPVGTALTPAERTVAEHRVLRGDPESLATLDDRVAKEYAAISVVQSPRTAQRFRDEVMCGLDLADHEALDRIGRRIRLTDDPEGGAPFERPTLILTSRQDQCVGYVDQFALLPHYPRATYVVLDVAGHNLQIDQPTLFDALMLEWLDRVAAES